MQIAGVIFKLCFQSPSGSVRFSAGAERLRGAFLKVASRRWAG